MKRLPEYHITKVYAMYMGYTEDTLNQIKKIHKKKLFESNEHYEQRLETSIKGSVILLFTQGDIIMNRKITAGVAESINKLCSEANTTPVDLVNNSAKNGYHRSQVIDACFSYILGGYKLSKYLKDANLRIRTR